MPTAGNITAVLTLNSSGFQSGLTKAITELDKFKSSATGVRALNDALTQMESTLQTLSGVTKSNLNTFSKLSTAINKMANGLKILQSSSLDVDQAVNTMNSIFNAFQGALNGTEIKVRGVSTVVKELANSERQSASVTNQVAVATQQYDKALELALPPTRNLVTGTRELANAQNQLQAEERETSGAVNQATNSMNRQATASKGLGRALSSLRMMGTMVGSMIAYNFVHNLAMATTETINAKSEMNGYFQMLGYTTKQTDEFNRALDKTVEKFPRLNKYALGETISSIGVEFELTTKEMKKAMPVVSMITSEYLRAGRNVNEASLAVKDILQGEFQRLSRETGVKAEQLKEAGWSGDKNDVMGLLKALDKVGKSRNWDTFVQKANSLNDAVLILQNRFGEWSADMVERVQPSIVHAFNTIMTVASNVSSVLTGALDWLSGDGWGQSIVKWGGLATAIIGVGTALIHLRTGANLTQIAQMGLTKSIGASILGLEAETVAQYGLRNAIVTTVTGIEAETLANEENIITRQARLQAIMSTITGYEMETVASRGATKSLIASIFGAKESTFAQKGLATAVAEATTQMEAEKLASMSLGQKIALIGATTIPAIAVVGAFAVAFSKLVMQTMEATTRMSNFYDIQKNGKQYVDDAKDSVSNLKDKIKELKDTRKDYAKGSQEYKNVGKAIDDLNDKVDLANQNVKDNYEAWQKVNSAQKNYNTTKQELQLDLQQKINKALVDTGLSEKEANELSNNYLNEAIDGSRQLYEALQSVSLQYSKQATGVAGLTKYWQDKGLTPEEIKLKIDPYIDSSNAIAQDIEKMKLSTDLVEVASTWGKLQVDQWDHSWKENLPKIEAGDWIGGLTGLGKGLAHGLADLPMFGDFWDWVFQQFKIKETYGGKGWAGLDQFFTDSWNNLKKLVIDTFVNIFDFSNLDDSSFDPVEQFGKWFGEGLNNFDENFFEPFKQPIIDAWNNFISFEWLNFGDGGDSGATGGFMKKIDIGALLQGLFSFTEGFDFSFITNFANNYIINPLSTAISNGIINIPIIGSIAQMLGLVPQENGNAYQTGYNLIDNLKRGVEQKISEIPIVSDIARMLGLIPQTNSDAYSKGHGVGDNIKRGEADGHKGIVDNVRNEMSNIINAISSQAQAVYDTAHDIGSQIMNGIQNALDMHSPSIISRELMPMEFGVYIPDAIRSSGDTAYQSAYQYGQAIKDGISATTFNTTGFDSAVGEYQDDAQIVADSSYYMGTTTTDAFNSMTLAVNQTTNTMSGNVASTYSGMQQKQQSSLNSMKNQNLQAYNDMYLKSNQSLIQMRDSTSNVTSQMVNAWSHMKNQIVASANQLKSESTSHFNQLSSTIGSFYRKIQNPSNWGAGIPTRSSSARKPVTGRKIATRIASNHGAGINPYQDSKSISLRDLMRMTGVSDATKLDLNTFLASIWGEHGFGWDDWSSSHYSYIKSTSDNWNMKAPMIMGRIQAGNGYKVGEFENGTPHLTWDSFMSTAEAVFNAIPYKFYWDSNWKGDWVSAIKAGACNCSDGSEALIALAQTFGFDGYKQHTVTRGGLGHFYAVINGRKMDTTNFQNHGSWTPLGAGIPTRTANPSGGAYAQGNKTVNVNVEISGTVYGVDDLDSKIQESVKEGLRAEFNDPYTVAI